MSSCLSELNAWHDKVHSQTIPMLPEEKMDRILGLLQQIAPQLELISNTFGAMKLDEEKDA